MNTCYCGRTFTRLELDTIRQLITDQPNATRAALSRLVCERLNWRRDNGLIKEMSCRVALLRMQEDGLLQLPPPRNGNNNGKPYRCRTQLAEPEPLLQVSSRKELGTLQLQLVTQHHESHRHNAYIDRYHYLGYQPLSGAQLRYFVRANQRIIALISFSAAAWTIKPRDRYIGWEASQRRKRLHFVVNNARFLILPWVRCKNLASTILSMAARQLPDDWEPRYGMRPVLLETFVERPRFHGTCYQAANWSYLGDTQGRGKFDVHNQTLLPKKAIWVYPLNKCFREILCR